MTAWAQNAALIDEVLASVKANPEKWTAARDAVRDAVQAAAWDVAWGVAWDTDWGAAWDTVWGPIWDASHAPAWGVIAALVTYDDAGQFMKLPAEHLQRLYRIDPHPMFLLLQPAAIVFGE